MVIVEEKDLDNCFFVLRFDDYRELNFSLTEVVINKTQIIITRNIHIFEIGIASKQQITKAIKILRQR